MSWTLEAKNTRPEQTGRRDLRYSILHRNYFGEECYATDIDFVEIKKQEDGKQVEVAIIETKDRAMKKDWNRSNSNITTQRKLADKAQIPFFLVGWKVVNDAWDFIVVAKNELAAKVFSKLNYGIGDSGQTLNLKQFVEFQYCLREIPIPNQVHESLCNPVLIDERCYDNLLFWWSKANALEKEKFIASIKRNG